MLSRTTHFLASIVAVAGFSACSSTYDDVFTYKKTTFKAPPKPAVEIVAPPSPTTDPFAVQPGTIPGGDPSMAIPGIGDPAPAIPGLEAPPAAPATPADPNMAPGTIPGLQN